MKYSQLHTKTLKDSKEYQSINATLLTRAGFIDQTMAGVYSFLPLGLRVLNKIEAIVREEMDKIGTEVYLPSLSPMHLWQTTGRLENIDILMKTSGANKISQNKSTKEYVLNCTHEDVITPIVQKFNPSYKDLPVAWYQIQSKFRNEARAKSGLLRGREFRMKDLYSFHVSLDDLKEYYEKSKKAYMNVYRRVGLGEETFITLASGGDFTNENSHEFQTRCESGEDLVFYDKSSNTYYNQEIAPSKAPAFEWDDEQKEYDEAYGENITGMDALVDFLQLPAQQCMKTILYQTETGQIIAVGVQGNYEINEEKVMKVVGCKKLTLAPETVVKEVTGAELGYAGIIGLPDSVTVLVDESMEQAVNFECGANKTNYHSVNVNWNRDVAKPEQFYDLKTAQPGDINPESGQVYETFAASEVGNIFPLGTKFSDAFGYTYTAEDGSQQPVYMGSYGIGTSRLMGVIVEKFHDENGIIWPKAVAPFSVHLISIKAAEEKAEELYQSLTKSGIEVLWDDRPISPGEKFADADLIGIPVRLVVSAKTGDKIEWKERTSAETQLLSEAEVLSKINE